MTSSSYAVTVLAGARGSARRDHSEWHCGTGRPIKRALGRRLRVIDTSVRLTVGLGGSVPNRRASCPSSPAPALPRAVTEGSRIENLNESGVRLWTESLGLRSLGFHALSAVTAAR